MKKPIPLFFLVAVTAWAVSATELSKNIRQVVEIHRLRPQTGSAGHRVPQIDCLSWRLGVETNNIRDWRLVPSECENYVGHYMLGQQYRDDCEVVADAAIEYANGLTLSGDGTEIWVFDIDETTLSNIPYYARSDVAFGAVPYNDTKFDEWVSEGKAPAIPASLRLYNAEAGYYNWEKLILKGVNDTGSAVEYKSGKRTELVNAGYKIVGNIGDQWSDLLGVDVGDRTFKLPDPMYYIG
nr:acid phosphatase 1-like [Ipomoea batatas]GMD37242.1 acid phosphatase 1-like [Ipomoea batatas]